MGIEGFEDLALLGSGGFSRVYRATQTRFGREVAIKVLTFEVVDDSAKRAFERESRAMGRVSAHPNIVTLFDNGVTDEGKLYIVMEYLEGGTYHDRLTKGPIPIEEVLSVGVKVCSALATAHQADILHRDLKPANIFISAYGEPALGDFGISTIDQEKTSTGTSGLTVHFAPPEVIDGHPASAQSDIYSLGATLWAMIEGRKPFYSKTDQSIVTTAVRILSEGPGTISHPDCPQELQELISEMMAKDRSERLASAIEVAERLREIQGDLGFVPTPIAVRGVAGRVDESEPSPQTGSVNSGPDTIPRTILAAQLEAASVDTVGAGVADSDQSEAPVGSVEAKGSDVPAEDLGPATTARSPIQALDEAGAQANDPTDDPGRQRRTWLLTASGAAAVIGLIAVMAFLALAGSDSDASGSEAAGVPASPVTSTTVQTVPMWYDTDLSGTTISVVTAFIMGPEDLKAAVSKFESQTGAEVVVLEPYNWETDEYADWDEMIGADVALFTPGYWDETVPQFEDYAQPLPGYLADTIEASFVPVWDEVSRDGRPYAVPIWGGLGNSLLWYSPALWADNGYQIPETWDEFDALIADMKSNGDVPFCLPDSYYLPGDLSAWIDVTMIRLHGVDVRNQVIAHEVPYNDPRVVEAVEEVERMMFTEGGALGGRTGLAEYDGDLRDRAIAGDCLVTLGSDEGPSWDQEELGEDREFFFFGLPRHDLSAPRVITANVSDFAAALNDDPGTMALLSYLASPEGASAVAARGEVHSFTISPTASTIRASMSILTRELSPRRCLVQTWCFRATTSRQTSIHMTPGWLVISRAPTIWTQWRRSTAEQFVYGLLFIDVSMCVRLGSRPVLSTTEAEPFGAGRPRRIDVERGETSPFLQ